MSRGLVYLDENDVCIGFGKVNGDGCIDVLCVVCDEGSFVLEGEEWWCYVVCFCI